MITLDAMMSYPMTTIQTLYNLAYLDSLADEKRSEAEKMARELNDTIENET